MTDANSGTYAAVDLGSNSFHLLVARREHGELRVIDRIKEMVRLGGGLSRSGKLDKEVRDRAISCLARFGQRIRDIPDSNKRAVGTQALRRMKKSEAFLLVAETALDCPVDIIAGREEARLIYLGVSQGVAGHEDRRLVIDIGGGSTELVIGEGLEPLEMESMQAGCVSSTRWYFKGGRITRKRWDRACRAVMSELQELQLRYRKIGWDHAVGSSGTINAVASICREMGWCDATITPDSVHQLRDRLIDIGSIDEIRLPGLSERRRPVIIGGLAVLNAAMESLGIKSLEVSPYALREGVLHDLLGRLEHRDPRDKTVKAFRARYGVDLEQVGRVQNVAMVAFDQLAADLELREIHRELLGWACELHECGLSVSHSSYQRHSGYLVENSDMAGFSLTEQLFLADLVRYHRRGVPNDFHANLPARLHAPLRSVLMCIRLAYVFCRSRSDAAIPVFRIESGEDKLLIWLDQGWAQQHPLTMTDLEKECRFLSNLGFDVELALEDGL